MLYSTCELTWFKFNVLTLKQVITCIKAAAFFQLFETKWYSLSLYFFFLMPCLSRAVLPGMLCALVTSLSLLTLSTSDSVLLSLTSGSLRPPHWQDRCPHSFWVHCFIALAIAHHVPYLCVCLPQATAWSRALSFILALSPRLSTGLYDGQSGPGHYVDMDAAF